MGSHSLVEIKGNDWGYVSHGYDCFFVVFPSLLLSFLASPKHAFGSYHVATVLPSK